VDQKVGMNFVHDNYLALKPASVMAYKYYCSVIEKIKTLKNKKLLRIYTFPNF